MSSLRAAYEKFLEAMSSGRMTRILLLFSNLSDFRNLIGDDRSRISIEITLVHAVLHSCNIIDSRLRFNKFFGLGLLNKQKLYMLIFPIDG